MKIIKYKFISAEINYGTEENQNIKQIIYDKVLSYSEANEEIAKQEAYNGEYTIEDDGEPESAGNPTLEERVGSLESDTADLAEALDQILTSGVVS